MLRGYYKTDPYEIGSVCKRCSLLLRSSGGPQVYVTMQPVRVCHQVHGMLGRILLDPRRTARLS